MTDEIAEQFVVEPVTKVTMKPIMHPGPCESPRERSARVWGDRASAARPRGAAKSALLLVILGAVELAGCGDDSSCPEGFTCIANSGGAGGIAGAGAQGGDGGIGGNAGGGGQGGDGGQGGGPNPTCTPTEGEPIGLDCGVFVSAASVGGDGSQAMPYSSITEAVAALGSAKHIYVCGGDSFSGSITLPSGVSLSGGLACADWTFTAANPKPTLQGTADLPALTILGSADRNVEFFQIVAANAVTAGGSSIGILADGATATLRGLSISAGSGAAGAAGTPQGAMPTPAAANGGNGGNGCLGLMMAVVGGGGGQNTCQAMSVEGGIGGSGTNGTNGGPGADGLPLGATAKGGTGEFGLPSPMPCSNGGIGAPGLAGLPGTGALSNDLGTLSSTGFLNAAGLPGQSAGSPGQGGGGGGGANLCVGAGPSGGGGGAGGCGGNVGEPGLGGGGSFGIVSVNATLTLDTVTITTSNGGAGGAGDAGQPGMAGGIEGTQGSGGGACPGGPGGAGGRGGAGGGGRGGPSVGIAYVGTPPTEEASIEITMGSAGMGGLGGDGGPGNQASAGAPGISEERQAW